MGLENRIIFGLVLLTALACDQNRGDGDGGDGGGPMDGLIRPPRDVGGRFDAGFFDINQPFDTGDPFEVGGRDGADSDLGPGPDVGPPILERPSAPAYNCTLTRSTTNHRPRSWGFAGHSSVSLTSGARFLARVEAMPPMPFEPAPAFFIVSSLALDGSFGTAVMPSAANPDSIAAPAMAPRGDGFALVWIEVNRLRFAAFDSAGTVVVSATDLAAGPADVLSRPQLVPFAGGFGLIFSAQEVDRPWEVRFLRLDDNGGVVGFSSRIGSSGSVFSEPAPAIAASDSRFAVIWREEVLNRSHIQLTLLDSNGATRTGPQRISVTDREGVNSGGQAGFEPLRLALMATASGFVAAWPEVQTGDFSMPGSGLSVVRVANLDGDGNLLEVPAAVRAGEGDVDEVEPSLFAFSGAIGLAWGRGTRIYICGGCVPDNRIDLVLLDPATLSPLSNVVSVPAMGGGLLRRDVAAFGADVLLTFDITFHVHAEPGSASVHCE